MHSFIDSGGKRVSVDRAAREKKESCEIEWEKTSETRTHSHKETALIMALVEMNLHKNSVETDIKCPSAQTNSIYFFSLSIFSSPFFSCFFLLAFHPGDIFIQTSLHGDATWKSVNEYVVPAQRNRVTLTLMTVTWNFPQILDVMLLKSFFCGQIQTEEKQNHTLRHFIPFQANCQFEVTLR